MRDQRRLAAIVSADVVGYSRLMGRDEGGTLAALKAHRRELIDPKIAEYDGRIVKTLGDGLLLEFPSVVEAVRCAVDVQRGMSERNANVPADRRIEFRIGINLGDIIIDEGDIFGDGVNVAARIQTLADVGGICVSRVVRDQVLDKLSFAFEEMGAQQVKNIARPVEIFRVREATDETLQPGVSAAVQLVKPWRPTQVKSTRWWAASTLAIVLAGVAVLLAPWQLKTEVRGGPPLSVAILPFASTGEDAAEAQFAAALTQDVTIALSRWRWTTVVSGREITSYTGKDFDARAIGRRLNVRYLVEAEARRAGDQRTINVSLVDADAGTNVWSDQLRSEEHAPRQTVATRVTVGLRNAIYEAEMRRAVANPVPGSAWDLVLRGDSVGMEGMTTDPIKAANASRKFYDEALRIDPNFVPALGAASLTALMVMENDLGAERSKYAGALDESDKLTARAFQIDSKDTFAWFARSVVLKSRGRLDEAMAAIAKAESLEPSSSTYVAHHGYFAMLDGRLDEAMNHAQRAIAMDRGLLGEEGFSLYVACAIDVLHGRYDEALPTCERAAVTSNQWGNQAWLVAAYAQRGDASKATLARSELIRRQPALTVDKFIKIKGNGGSEEFLARLEAHVAGGLRKAGLPER